jgi:flavodoxin I
MTCIIFGSSTGDTENVATRIAEKQKDETKIINVNDMTPEVFEDCGLILLGSSTWGDGELQDDWEAKIDILKAVDLSGKRVGFFGCGDQEMYSDTFVNAIGILYEAVKDSNGEIVGSWPTDGYSFSESAAVIDGKFIGLALDENNQSELTESRISEWVIKL